MTLRIVAGERCGKCRFESTREPTGSAESTYSRIRATSTSRCRASICPDFTAGRRTARPRAEIPTPSAARRPLAEPRGGHAIRGAQSENESLGEPLAGGESLRGLDGQRPGRDGGAPPRERLDVAVAYVADEAAAAGPRRKILAGAPVAEVVPRPVTGPGIVGNLVMLESARGRRARQRPVLRDHVVLGRQPGHAAGAPRTAAVERERVGREVIRRPVEETLDVSGPGIDGQIGQAVHEVDADVVVAGFARRLERRPGAPRIVEPT